MHPITRDEDGGGVLGGRGWDAHQARGSNEGEKAKREKGTLRGHCLRPGVVLRSTFATTEALACCVLALGANVWR